MRIGICDDSDISRQNMLSLCHEYFQNNIGKIEYQMFESGEDSMKIVISTTVNMPIYEQIVNQKRDAVISGELKEKEGMPLIRVLAKDLAVSVITTKRAYEELEKEGVIESVPGRGFYVCEQKNDHLREKQMMNIESRMSDLLAECENAGMTIDDVIDMVRVLGKNNG